MTKTLDARKALRLEMAQRHGINKDGINKMMRNADGWTDFLSEACDEGKVREPAPKNEIWLYGEIISDSSADWYEELGFTGFSAPKDIRKALADADGDVLMRINSGGGSTYAASEMCSRIDEWREKNPDKKMMVKIEGIAGSAATWLMLQSDSIAIAEFAQVMIHKAWTCACGNSKDFESIAGVLAKVDDAKAQAYADRTGKPVDEIMGLMEAETFFTADEAVEFGLADEVASMNKKKKSEGMDAGTEPEPKDAKPEAALGDAESKANSIFDILMED